MKPLILSLLAAQLVAVDATDVVTTLKLFEGFSATPYLDTRGHMTIGYGHRLYDHKGDSLTEESATLLLKYDVDKATTTLRNIYPDIGTHPQPVQDACVHMIFQLGPTGFMKFVNLRKGLTTRRYDECAKEALSSRWAVQTPVRAQYVAKLFMEGTK